MTPSAIVCALGEPSPEERPEEAQLRAAGFNVAGISWNAVAQQQRGWMQLAPVLDDPAVQAWVFIGRQQDVTPELRSRISLLTLSLTRTRPPATAIILTEGGELGDFPPWLDVAVFQPNRPFAGKLTAARFAKKPPSPALPLYIASRLDPLIGQWIAVGVSAIGQREGFMIGVTHAKVTAFGIGERGQIPQKSELEYPQCGIRGNWGEHPFSACAARNVLDGQNACWLCVEGVPHAIFLTAYPDGAQEGDVAYVELV